jgi:putative ABC transport system ATP-binding protein
MQPAIKTVGLTKVYQVGDIDVHALQGIDMIVDPGEFVAIMGTSGSGKSTLMNLLGCLDQPTSGDYYLAGTNVKSLSRDEYADIRNQRIGFVFQGFNLLARTSALENVELPLLYDRAHRVPKPRRAAVEALNRVGLAERMNHEPTQLSGGQQQRVAIARALVNRPSILLADEPTGNLDSRTSVEVMSVFQQLNQEGMTILLVTHDAEISLYARRIIELHDGCIVRNQLVNGQRLATSNLQAVRRGVE